MDLFEEREWAARGVIAFLLENADGPAHLDVKVALESCPEEYREAMQEAVRYPGTGLSMVSENISMDDIPAHEDIDGVMASLVGATNKIQHVDGLTKVIEGISSGDAVQQRTAVDRLMVSDLLSVDDPEIEEHISIGCGDAPEISDDMARREGPDFPPTNTVFDTWCILGCGELGLVLAPPEVGKTTSLIDITAGWAEAPPGGEMVIFFSEEMRAAQMYIKLGCRLTGKDTFNRTAVNKALANLPNRVIVEAHMPGTATVHFLEKRARWHIANNPGFRLKGIVTDYLGALGGPSTGEYDKMNYNTLAMRAMLRRLHIPGWSAVQPQRGPTKDMQGANPMFRDNLPVLTKADIALCWAIPQITDYIVSLNQTINERDENPPQVRLFRAKTRMPRPGAPSHSLLEANIEYAQCRIL